MRDRFWEIANEVAGETTRKLYRSPHRIEFAQSIMRLSIVALVGPEAPIRDPFKDMEFNSEARRVFERVSPRLFEACTTTVERYCDELRQNPGRATA